MPGPLIRSPELSSPQEEQRRGKERRGTLESPRARGKAELRKEEQTDLSVQSPENTGSQPETPASVRTFGARRKKKKTHQFYCLLDYIEKYENLH